MTAKTDLWATRWGLLDASAYAGDRKDSCHPMTGAAALQRRFIQTNPRRMLNALVVDVDRPSAIMDTLERPHEHPDPSWVIETNRGAHVGWWLRDPVCRSDYAQEKPLRYAARVQEGLVRVLKADPAFTGFITRNPVFPGLSAGEVIWGTENTYTLADLRTSAMPRQLPKKIANIRSDLGRNCALFEHARHEVYRLNRIMGYPTATALYHASLSHLLDVNGTISTTVGGPLPLPEVRSMARSMAKWTTCNHTPEQFTTIQSTRGQRSAEKRWGGKLRKHVEQLVQEGNNV